MIVDLETLMNLNPLKGLFKSNNQIILDSVILIALQTITTNQTMNGANSKNQTIPINKISAILHENSK